MQLAFFREQYDRLLEHFLQSVVRKYSLCALLDSLVSSEERGSWDHKQLMRQSTQSLSVQAFDIMVAYHLKRVLASPAVAKRLLLLLMTLIHNMQPGHPSV